MGAGRSNMKFVGDSFSRRGNLGRPPVAQGFAPGLEATPPTANPAQSRLGRMEEFMQSKGSPEYEQVMERIRGMNAMKNTGSRF